MNDKDTTTKPELLPCPFCGEMPNDRLSTDGSLYVIECTGEECFFKPRHTDYLRYKTLIVNEWNRRA